MLEAALFLPVLFLLLIGMVELARIAYTYFTLQKVMYALARYLGTSQGVNFCDDSDPAVVAAKNYAITGATDASGAPILANLTADMIQVRVEQYNSAAGELGVCACTPTGCDAAQGGPGPDFLVVSFPEGYPIQIRIPFMPLLDPIPLKPEIRLPYGGT
jgi:Flp pilus assembly protein TadG